MPRPISRCQRRLTIVRVKRPFSGCVISAASCFSRSGCGAAGVDLPELGEEPRRPAPSCRSACRSGGSPAAASAIDRGQAVRLVELPAVDEAVVARGALQVDAEERPGRRSGRTGSRRSGRRSLRRASLMPLMKPSRLRRRRGDQLAGELVVGLVGRRATRRARSVICLRPPVMKPVPV